MSSNVKGIVLGLALLAAGAAAIGLLTTAFEERDTRTQEQHQRRD